MQPSTRKPAKPSAAKPPTADLPELDLGEAPPAPAKTAVTVSAITAVAGADNAAIDAQLDALATRTTVEDLARRGKKNLKTLSERQLKEWIHEALRRVISTTTTVSAAEQERMISATRAELGNLMSEAGSAHAEREALHARIAQLNADRETMQRRLSELEQRLDDAAGQIADAETAAATAADPDIEEVESLRAELGETYSRLSASENERASLQKTLGARLIATSEVAAAVLELDRSCYGGLHMQQAQTDAAGDAAAFYADEAAARATAESLTRDLIGLRTDLASAAPGVPDESIAADRLRLASLVGRPAGDPDALAAAERERDEARSAAENAKRTVARLLAQGEAKANEAVTARITRAEQQARSANDRLAQCEGELAAITRRHAELEGRATSLSDELAAARDSLRNAAGRAEALSAEVSRLTRENAELRASAARSSALAAECDRLALIARNAEQARREPTSAPAAARASEAQNTALAAECDRLAELAKTVGQARRDGVQPAATATPACESTPARLAFANGAWRWTWGTGARLRVATFRGAWSAAEFLDLPPAANVVHLAQSRYGAWRDANGHGQFQLSGSAPQQLGAVQATPLLAAAAPAWFPSPGSRARPASSASSMAMALHTS